jgi:hypothetical protein
MPVVVTAKLLGLRVPGRITEAALRSALIAEAWRLQLSVAIVGGAPEVNERAREPPPDGSGARRSGSQSYGFDPDRAAEIANRLRALAPAGCSSASVHRDRRSGLPSTGTCSCPVSADLSEAQLRRCRRTLWRFSLKDAGYRLADQQHRFKSVTDRRACGGDGSPSLYGGGSASFVSLNLAVAPPVHSKYSTTTVCWPAGSGISALYVVGA